jgi:3-oxoacyl-[acyl-carrier-protein] synthase-3
MFFVFASRRSVDAEFATAAELAVRGCLDESSLGLSDVDMIVAAPARRRYRAALARRLGVPVDRIVVADDERMHTSSLAAALDRGSAQLPPGAPILLVAASAGITAGAALYRQPPPPTSRG